MFQSNYTLPSHQFILKINVCNIYVNIIMCPYLKFLVEKVCIFDIVLCFWYRACLQQCRIMNFFMTILNDSKNVVLKEQLLKFGVMQI